MSKAASFTSTNSVLRLPSAFRLGTRKSCPLNLLQFKLKTRSSSLEERKRTTISDASTLTIHLWLTSRPMMFFQELRWSMLDLAINLLICIESSSFRQRTISTQLEANILMRLQRNVKCMTSLRTNGKRLVTWTSLDTTILSLYLRTDIFMP